ncbi:histidine triad (HIT) family protein [Mesobacillus persicus]|uniref:Histidine triad (HIT) family protein n=1 Tax=Mesobacillus persicus TaxID=930146 RepID=A0A1H8DXW9_9BACI|nr:HIT family protein [Mesobacillus persicus]SEN12159.1 histidine triad (HIT) family protein [Mesobacillus persicus]
MSDCIFCKIINGEIPSAKVFENEHVYAFLDIGQVTKGHTLVIPKVHKENVYELTEEISTTLFKEVPKIANAIKEAYDPIGLNVLNNNGELAGQSVFHFHMHLIPRYGEGDGFGAVWKTHNSEYNQEELQTIASDINKKL